MQTFWQDLRYGARVLAREPGFAATAGLTLAVGIGATTAMFSAVNVVLLRPLPYRDPAGLVLVSEEVGQADVGVSAGEYVDYRDRTKAFSQVAAFEKEGFDLTGDGTPLRVNAARISASAFPLLGVSPILGRAFTEEEDRSGADGVALLSHSLWATRYGESPAVLGKTLRLDGAPYTVIGVMPASFRFPFEAAPLADGADVWVPEAFAPERLQERTREFGVGLVGRLRPGVGLPQAQREIEGVAASFMKDHPESYPGNIRVSPRVQAFAPYSVRKARPVLLLLTAAVAFVLLIGCANVANLLLARASSRTREMAVRAALGARRSRLMRQCLVESLLLSLLGAGSGLLTAGALITALRRWAPQDLPRLHEVALDPAALWFTLVLSIATCLVFGLVPSWRLSGVSPGSSMKDTGPVGPSRAVHRLQGLVVVGEISLALTLLLGGSLLLRSLTRLLDVPLGFRPESTLVVRAVFDGSRYPDPARRMAAQREILDRLALLPNVVAAASASHLPLSDARQIGFRLEHAAPDDYHWAENSVVSPGYFQAMDNPLVRGRGFSESDSRSGVKVAVINETMARRFFPERDPIGERFQWGDLDFFTIVGVAADIRVTALDADPPPMIYQSLFQVERGAGSQAAFILRLSPSPAGAEAALLPSVREQIWSVDKDVPLYDARTLASLVSASLAQRRFTATLVTAFSVVALLLSAMGLFGLVSYLVSERARELAVRLALGATRTRIYWIVLRRAAALGLAGCAVGLALFALGSRLLVTSLYEVHRFDPATLVSVPALLLAVSLLAAYGPARRAAHTDPSATLRCE